MNATKTAFQAVARELAAAFETATRTSGVEFKRIRPGALDWVKSAELARAAHEAVDGSDPRFPCDWVYSLMARAADWLADRNFADADAARDAIGEFADGAVDVSIPRLFSWAADHANNRALADEFFADSFDAGAAMAGGFESGVVAALQGGQYLGAERVASAIVEAVETEAASREE